MCGATRANPNHGRCPDPILLAVAHGKPRVGVSRSNIGGLRGSTRWIAFRDVHGKTRDDDITMLWPALCAEVAKVWIRLREGKLIEMPNSPRGRGLSIRCNAGKPL